METNKKTTEKTLKRELIKETEDYRITKYGDVYNLQFFDQVIGHEKYNPNKKRENQELQRITKLLKNIFNIKKIIKNILKIEYVFLQFYIYRI